MTRELAPQSLNVFVADRLPSYGRFQDAIWRGEVGATPPAGDLATH